MSSNSTFRIAFACIISATMVACANAPNRPAIDQLRLLRQQANQAYLDKDYPQSIDLYTQVQEYVKNDPIVWFRLGNSYSHLEKPKLAIAAYEKALALDPRFSKAWHNMGVMQLRQSANTWSEMTKHIPETDPLHKRAVLYSQGILEVLNSDQKDDQPTSE